jgi:hypothetical protein
VAVTSFQKLYLDGFTLNGTYETLTSLIIITLDIVGFPLFCCLFLHLRRDSLENPDTLRHYEALYLNLDTSRRHTILMPFFFLLRRMAIAISYIFLASYPVIQIFVHFLCSFMLVIYLFKVMPYKERLLNIMELINEGSQVISCYFMLLFTDYLGQDQQLMRYKIGWFYTYLVLIVILLNWLAMFLKLLMTVLTPLKKRFCPLLLSGSN